MAKMNLYIYMKKGYEDFNDFVRRKNKANSNPNKLVLCVVEWSQSWGKAKVKRQKEK